MENSLKGLILAAGTVITCLVISLGFYLSKEAQATASTGTNQIGKINSEFAENDKTMYDNVRVSGSEVINAIKKFENETIGISVSTNSGQTFYGYSLDLSTGEIMHPMSNGYDESLTQNAATYINPYAEFEGEVIRNANEVITGIAFTQV